MRLVVPASAKADLLLLLPALALLFLLLLLLCLSLLCLLLVASRCHCMLAVSQSEGESRESRNTLILIREIRRTNKPPTQTHPDPMGARVVHHSLEAPLNQLPTHPDPEATSRSAGDDVMVFGRYASLPR
jgi:hypothetical protein